MSWSSQQQELHITVGSVPKIRADSGAVDLQNDLQMTKAALLYADHARLCGLSSSWLLNLVELGDIPKNERLAFLERMQSWALLNQEAKKNLKSISESYEYARRRRYTRKGQELLKQLHQLLEENWKDAKNYLNAIVQEVGGEGIVQAVKSGLLEVHNIEYKKRVLELPPL